MGQAAKTTLGTVTTKALGDAAEAQALRYLQSQGLLLMGRNYRTPGRGGGEIDLIMREADATLVFVEVRQRSQAAFGGALSSITRGKQMRIIRAAQHYLMRLARQPACRFDVVVIEADGQPQWIKAAFDAS